MKSSRRSSGKNQKYNPEKHVVEALGDQAGRVHHLAHQSLNLSEHRILQIYSRPPSPASRPVTPSMEASAVSRPTTPTLPSFSQSAKVINVTINNNYSGASEVKQD